MPWVKARRLRSTGHTQATTTNNAVWTQGREYKGEQRERKPRRLAASQVMGKAWQSAKLRSLNFINKHWGAIKGF